MGLKIAIDFDGVCTDLSFVKKQKIDEFEFLFSPFSITISKIRPGIFEIASVFGLFSELSIITSRPIEDKKFIVDWLSKNKLNTFFQEVLCCGEISKSDIMTKHGITLLIDDQVKHINNLIHSQIGIYWNSQTWLEVVNEIFNHLTDSSIAKLTANNGSTLCEIVHMSNLGSSPVFLLTFSDETKLKLRICLTENVKKRIVNFLSVTKKNCYEHVSQLVDTNGLAILKTYVAGISISEFNKIERIIYIEKAGIALAKLHSIKTLKYFTDQQFSLSDNPQSLLVFSADNYNMIVTPENDVAFIDLEACNLGSRWIDYLWTENLLCNNNLEKKALEKGYFSIFDGKKATEHEIKLAEMNYKLWLTYQLQNSADFNLNESKTRQITCSLSELWN